jgi:aspartate/methionine/tyrosine aminotransferase
LLLLLLLLLLLAAVVQEAVANMLHIAKQPYEGFANYYDWLRVFFTKKRDALVSVLRAAKLNPVIPDGGYFVMADTSVAHVPTKYLIDSNGKPVTRDYALCRWMTSELGVSPIPPSAFYAPEYKHLAQNYARFAFCKKDEDIALCGTRLLRLTNTTAVQ